MAENFIVNQHDLTYILKQIQIAELHANTPGMTLVQAIMQVYGVSAADAALLPAGLRTVDGSFNNLLPGQSDFGAAGTLFPRLTDPTYTTGSGGPFFGVTNNNYTPTANGTGMSVVDSDPRTISNLIVDQSVANPAAIYAALRGAGIEGSGAVSAVAAITNAYQGTLNANGANAAVTAAQAVLNTATTQLGAATTAAAATQAVVNDYAAANGLTATAATAATTAQTAVDAFVTFINSTSFVSLSGAAAAAFATQAVVDAYAAANGLTAAAGTTATAAQTALDALVGELTTPTLPGAEAPLYTAAVDAAAAALAAAQAVVTALGGNPSAEAAATLAGAQALVDALNLLADGGVDSTDSGAAQTASAAYLPISGLGGSAEASGTGIATSLAGAILADDAADAQVTLAISQQNAANVAFVAAMDAAAAALVAAQAVVAALDGNPSTDASATVAGAQALLDALAPLDDNGFDGTDLTPAQSAATNYAGISGPTGTASASATGIAASLALALDADVLADGVLAMEIIEHAVAQAAFDLAADLAVSTGTPAATAAALAAALVSFGLHVDDAGGLVIEAHSPDIGLSPAFNNVMTIFGQFFDHGLDLVNKGGNGTVFIPLQADDPLIAGADHVFGTADDLPAYLRFMTLNRATQTIDANGVAQHTNATTSFVDQNQTYTSHASHQVFLREYVRIDVGTPGVPDIESRSTGRLLDGETAGQPDGTIATWADVKASALEFLGIILTDADVGRVPMLLTDAYGNLILGANGYAQMVMAPLTVGGPSWLQEGTATGITTAGSEASGVAFLVDIAHNAAPGAGMVADADSISGNAVAVNPLTGQRLEYDDELLNEHFLTGDGRGNENIALTAVHATFHAEHNRLVAENMHTILATGDLAFINEWLLVDLNVGDPIPTDITALTWDGSRLFQAARFVTEMQYQHMVFEEFARRIQPMIDPFVFTNTAEIDASILAEFAHTVYRFGHSMLSDTVDRLENDLTTVNGDTVQVSLIDAFLNPGEYLAGGADFAAIQGALFRGMSRDVGSEIDEFIIPALRSNLLGLPLDLAALNIARGRETGVPTLNETRTRLYNDFGLADLKPYESWNEFATHMRNPISVINFIAAYGNHASLIAADTLAEMREAATLLVFGDGTNGDGVTIAGVTYTNADRLAFLNGTGIYDNGAIGGVGERGGLDNIDLWIGGLAEQINEFGGMLGSTFNFIFEYQMQQLQNGDRLYYLSRTQGLNLLTQLEQNTFADIVARNSDLSQEHSTHLNPLLFVTPDLILELDRQIAQQDYNLNDPDSRDPVFDGIQELLTPKVIRDYTNTTTVNGHDFGAEIHFLGGEHVVIGGTEGNDIITSDKGIDGLYGDGGDDYLNAGMESDEVFGGTGDDIIEDPFGDDFLRGGAGNDVITAARGFDLLFGGLGKDALMLGQDFSEVFGGEGDDFILGSDGADGLLGNEGNDWIEGGEGFDTISGENSELFFNSTIIGHDIAWGQGNDQDYDLESGDDIAFTGAGIQRSEGMFGFDWAITKYDISAINLDLGIGIANTVVANILRDRFDLVEAASGWQNNDTIRGDSRGSAAVAGDPVLAFNDHILDAAGIARIDGMAAWLDGALETLFGPGATTFRDGNILLGGGGSDTLEGRGGFDIIDGDAWLNVRIRVMVNGVEYSAESLTSNSTVAGPFAGRLYPVDGNGNPVFTTAAFGGRSLTSLLLDRTVNPGDMTAVREILIDDGVGDLDRAVFTGAASQYDIEGAGAIVGGYVQVAYDLNGDGFISIAGVGNLTDDTDLIRNIELLQFSDQTLNLADVVLALPIGTGVDFNAILPGLVDLPAVGTQIATLTSDAQSGVFTLRAGSSASFGLTAAGALTVSAALAQSSTHTLNVGVTNSGGTYVETMRVLVGSTGADLMNGNAGTDVFYGLANSDAINGGAGADVLYGQAGSDTLNGDADDDLLMGGTGGDSINGGSGNDRIIYQWGHGVDAMDGGADTDRLEIVGTAANQALTVNFNGTVITAISQVGTIIGVEAITADLLGAADLLSYTATTTTGVTVNLGTGSASGFASIANIANVTGTDFGDILTGDTGANQLLGRGGDDLFIATVDNALDEFSGAAGVDTVDYSAYTTGLTINMTLPEPVPVVGSGTTNDILRGIDNLIGGSGDDVLTGNNVVNNFTGGDGNDRLDGGGNIDVLFGGAGADTLIGGTGRDTMTGGIGDDHFVFVTAAQSAVGANSDTITDFGGAGAAVGDLIDLSAFPGAFVFIGGAAFTATAVNQLRVVVTGGDTFIQLDTDSDTGVESQIRLTGIHALTAADFIV